MQLQNLIAALPFLAAYASAAATTTFPSASGSTSLSSVKSVSGTFDCGMKRYDRGSGACNGQAEGGDADAVFLVASGGTVKNCIIGANQAEGIHCKGACTIQNVWWEDVCEDALTIKQSSGTSYVKGGGAQKADDKVVQHNGGGTVAISDFYVKTFGKLYRSCGNCSTQYKRTVTITGVVAKSGSLLCGINSNYGDKCTVKSTCISSVSNVCTRYKGNSSGSEPTKIGSGNDGTYCVYGSDVKSC